MRSVIRAFGLLAILFPLGISAQSSLAFQRDPAEVRFIRSDDAFHPDVQEGMRSGAAWRHFLTEHPGWSVHFNEATGFPHRAFGRAFPLSGNDPVVMAEEFVRNDLAPFGIPFQELIPSAPYSSGKFTWINFKQIHQGIEVLGSRVVVKLHGNDLVMFGGDAYPVSGLNLSPVISSLQGESIAQTHLTGSVTMIDNPGELFILPVPENTSFHLHLVWQMKVHTRGDDGIPAVYLVLVDAHNGDILYRANQVRHTGTCSHQTCPAEPPMVTVTADISGSYLEENPWVPAVTGPMPNIYVTVGGVNYPADESGQITLTANPGTSAQIRLMGPWARIYTNGSTPSSSFTLQSTNPISVNSFSNIGERSVYVNVQRIHQHMKNWMPSFTGMDFQLPANVDLNSGTCNAFYDGLSINFYNLGQGCNSTSLVADVAFHEYGHGINDYFYQSLGGSFVNGAMGEGYADFWALSLTDSPLLGAGFYMEDLDPIRRYDEDPKVYPDDLTGEVHADGEIIMGAWWDTHLLMGGDWNITMPLFVEAYAGLQAEAFDGNEGQAYTDVLIDVLQADDDDGDFTNGTPHGNAIVEGFALHGITLLSNSSLAHEPVQFSSPDEGIQISADLTIQFPFAQYLDAVQCHYRINDGLWSVMEMNHEGGGSYAAEIPGQEAGSVIYYYLTTMDINGVEGNAIPVGAAHDVFPNLPFNILVGVEQVGIQDCDDNEFWGGWQTGISGDNASTGRWELDVSVGSLSTDVSPPAAVQPFDQVTPGGEFCFVTGNAGTTASPLGENDVDDGKTTLQSPVMDMSDMQEPVVAYYRWYTNSPPSGANPGADYWQVRMSNNGGASWVYVENTLTSDASWRRNAFRVRDYLEPTDEMRFQFIASDSVRPGAYLDGGSLVEAAMDDFILYEAIGLSVETLRNDGALLAVWPNPAQQEITVQCAMPVGGKTEIHLYNELGQRVHSWQPGALPQGVMERTLRLPDVTPGVYHIQVKGPAVFSSRLIITPE